MAAKPGRLDRKIGGIKIKFKRSRYSQFLVVGSMSSGKSTLINALLGKRLLVTGNFACTSKTTKIVVKKRLLENGQMDSPKAIMVIDTPGGNYSGNNFHRAEMRRILSSFDKGMILYVLNASQIAAEDDYKILSEVRSAIEGKNVEIAFVLNKIDSLDRSRENLQEIIKNEIVKFIEKVGIKDSIIFPCSSEAAFLFKCALNGEPLSESESDKLYKYYIYFYHGPKRQGAIFAPDCSDVEETVTYDGERYLKNKIKIALDNTGILEIENFMGLLST